MRREAKGVVVDKIHSSDRWVESEMLSEKERISLLSLMAGDYKSDDVVMAISHVS